MSKTNFYRHCQLKKDNLTTSSYIPECYAVVGKTLQLKENDIWDNGWEVISAGELVAAEYAEAISQAFKRIWKPSTILTERGRK